MAKLKNSNRKDAEEKLPPHDIESEKGVLGCALFIDELDPSRSTKFQDQILKGFKGRTDYFYDEKHQIIIGAVFSLMKRGAKIDVLTVQSFLKDDGNLELCGGISYLNSLPEIVSSPEHLQSYLKIVEEKYNARKAVNVLSLLRDEAFHLNGDSSEFRQRLRVAVDNLLIDDNPSGRFITVSELDAYDPKTDENNRIGNRWLCKGGKLLIPAASGAGKSTLIMQMDVLFALGMDFCGIKPHGPNPDGHLTSLIVGDENDIGDLAEQFQGTRDFLRLNSFDNSDVFDLLEKRIKFWHCPALSGQAFLAAIELELKRDPRDICVIDPLVSFAGVDITKQDQAAIFLRQGLTRIGEATGVIWFIVHHTTKQTKDSRKFAKEKLTSDFQYEGAGSYDIVGWARAVMTLNESSDGVFRLVFSKRGKRAGTCHPDGTPSTVLWMRHSTEGLHWVQCDPPSEPEQIESTRVGRPNKKREIACSNLFEFLSGCVPAGESQIGIAKRLVQYQAAQGTIHRDIKTTCAKEVISMLVDNQKLAKGPDGLYRKGPNA